MGTPVTRHSKTAGSPSNTVISWRGISNTGAISDTADTVVSTMSVTYNDITDFSLYHKNNERVKTLLEV